MTTYKTLLPGVLFQHEDKKTVCNIVDLTPELKGLIREELTFALNGRDSVTKLPEHYTYKHALFTFLDRYKEKKEETQMGMIGELLSHILLSRFFKNLTSLSIWKNKEDRSIKKGFDIIYCDLQTQTLWYSEVKSGHTPEKETAKEANKALLMRAYTDLKHKFDNDTRDSLWDSAMHDVALVMPEINATPLRKLLAKDSPFAENFTSKDKHIITISVLYHAGVDTLKHDDLDEFIKSTTVDGYFKSILMCSIQKKTFQKVAAFLESEAA